MARRATTAHSPRQGALRLVLASASPRRLELLEQIGLSPEVVAVDVDERLLPGEAPRDAARRLAALKAETAAARVGAGPAHVVAADTVVAVGADALGKPAGLAEARAMLGRLSGRAHEVHTGFVVLALRAAAEPPARVAGVVTTRVRVKPLAAAEIEGYLATGEPLDKAGAYAIQGAGAFMVEGVEGSVTNVIGLPLAEVLAALAALGGPGPFGVGR